jgi:hypothetical protein
MTLIHGVIYFIVSCLSTMSHANFMNSYHYLTWWHNLPSCDYVTAEINCKLNAQYDCTISFPWLRNGWNELEPERSNQKCENPQLDINLVQFHSPLLPTTYFPINIITHPGFWNPYFPAWFMIANILHLMYFSIHRLQSPKKMGRLAFLGVKYPNMYTYAITVR